MKNKDTGCSIALFVMMVLSVFVICATSAACNEQTVTITTETAEVTSLNISEDYHDTKYYVSICNANISKTLDVSESEFSSLKVGDIVTVEITKEYNTTLPDDERWTIKSRQ